MAMAMAVATSGWMISAVSGRGQGCEPIRHMALSLSAEGISYLRADQWDVAVSYRYLHSDKVFVGDKESPALEHPNGPILDLHSIDVTLAYAINSRLSAGLTVPFLSAELSSVRDHGDGLRHHTSAAGLGDVRLVGNVWVLDPEKHQNGNWAIGVGFKAPTGDEQSADKYYSPTGVDLRPVDVSGQPGDGGWGLVLESQAFFQLMTNTFVYANGSYLINPREHNDAILRTSAPGNPIYHSVPDQYLARVGISQGIRPVQGLSVTLGGRIDGMPAHDLIGGSGGFRRPGYAVAVEPGLNYSRGNYNVSLTTPVAVYRNRMQSVSEKKAGIHGGGGFADFLIVLNATRRF